GAGIIFSLVKGIDYEEALVLSVAMVLLAPCRPYFYRRASLLEARFTPGWIAAICLSLLSMIWLAGFANKHVHYSSELWWTFTFAGDAPRSLRASLAAVAFAGIAGLIYLLRPSRPSLMQGTVSDEVRNIIVGAPSTYAYLALLGDKTILLNETKT